MAAYAAHIFGDLTTDLETLAGGRLFAGARETGEFFSLLPSSLSGFLKGFGVDENGEACALVSGNLGPSGTAGLILPLVPFAVPEPAALGLFRLGVAALAIGQRRRRT